MLIPASHGDLASLLRAARGSREARARVHPDPVLDPIHFGFTGLAGALCASCAQQLPDAAMLMGTGNLTELTDADTSGITALLLGICSELAIRNVLVVQVSPHTRRTLRRSTTRRGASCMPRKRDASLPKGYGGQLLQVHDEAVSLQPRRRSPRSRPGRATTTFASRSPRTASMSITATATMSHGDALALFPKLGVESDGAHAFYLGAGADEGGDRLALGKRYAQDEPLDWGVAADRRQEDRTRAGSAPGILCARRRSKLTCR